MHGTKGATSLSLLMLGGKSPGPPRLTQQSGFVCSADQEATRRFAGVHLDGPHHSHPAPCPAWDEFTQESSWAGRVSLNLFWLLLSHA